jgi:hypothetical protein
MSHSSDSSYKASASDRLLARSDVPDSELLAVDLEESKSAIEASHEVITDVQEVVDAVNESIQKAEGEVPKQVPDVTSSSSSDGEGRSAPGMRNKKKRRPVLDAEELDGGEGREKQEARKVVEVEEDHHDVHLGRRKVKVRQTPEMALYQACRSGNTRVVSALVNKGVDVNVPQLQYHNETALMAAVAFNHKSVVGVLLSSTDADVNATDRNGQTCLHRVVSTGNASILSKLLAAKADASLADKAEWTPLMTAYASGNSNMAHKLIQSISTHHATLTEDEHKGI